MKKFGFLILGLILTAAVLLWDEFYYWSGPLEFLKDNSNLYCLTSLFAAMGLLNILTRIFPSKFSPLWSQVFSNIKTRGFWIFSFLLIGLYALQSYNPYLLPSNLTSFLSTIFAALVFHALLRKTAPFIAIFGDLDYRKPNWMASLSSPKGLLATLKKVNKLYAAATLVLIIGGSLAYKAYQNRPKPKEPEKLSFNLYKPGRTTVYKNSTGEVQENIPNLQIRFDKSAAPLELVGKNFDKDTPRVFPKISGKWKWTSDSLLVFEPSEKWLIGEKYYFQLSELKLPKRYIQEKTEDEFTLPKLAASVNNKEFYEDPRDPKVNKVIFSLNFNYPIDRKTLKESIILKRVEYGKSAIDEFSQDREATVISEKQINSKIIFDDLGYKAHIHTETLSIPKHSARVTLEVLSGLKSTFPGLSTESPTKDYVDLPGMYDYFNLDSADLNIVENEKAIPEHIGVLQFSAGVYPSALTNKIKIYELPKKKKVNGRNIRHWSDYSATALGLDRSRLSEKRVSFLETSQEYPKLHSFKFDLKPSTYYILSIEKGITSASGFVLAEKFEKIIYARPFPKKLKLMHKGNILSLSGEKKLNIYSTNVKEIEVEIGQLLGDQVQHILTQTNGDYTNPRFRNEYQFSKENLAHFEKFKIRVLHASDKKPSYSSINFGKYLKRRVQGKKMQGIFFVKIKDTKGRRLSDKRLIVVSDLGVVMKMDVTEDHHFFVQSLSTGKPVGNALIQVVGKNGLSMSSTYTDSQGYAEVPKIESDGDHRKRPKGIIIKKGEDLAYLRYKDYNTQLNNSRFMVGGISNSRAKDSLRGFLFSDRGIYRPGEEVRIGLIVKGGQWDKSLKGIPVDVVVNNSQGKSIIKKERVLTKLGLDDLVFDLSRNAPTGSYSVHLYNFYENNREKYRTLIGSVDFKVEEFLPDRLKISAIFNKSKSSGWIDPSQLKGEVNLQNLFGFPATGNEVRAKYKVSPVSLYFAKFRDFRFDNPTKTFSSYSESLSNTKTDDSGNASYALNMDKFAKKVFRLSFFAEGFEKESGRSVTAKTTALVSPYSYLVGLKSIDDYSYIKRDDKRSVEFIAINSDLSPMEPSDLSIRFIEKKFVNVLTKRPNGSFAYEAQLKKEVLYKKPISISKAGTKFKLDTSKAGDFIVQIRDKNENLFSSFEYTVIGARDLSRSLTRNAELKIKLNKRDYEQGDTIELEIRSAYVGKGLITIERDKVYDFVWFNQNQKTTTQRIVIPSNLEGNAYLNVTLLRSSNSNEIYTMPLSHGVEPFTISKDSRREKISLSLKDLYKPGTKVDIKYSTRTNSKVILYAINEGILQFANYKKPNPLDFYFRKKALEVSTYQILDRLLPEFAQVSRNLAPGGGYGALSEQLNPFNRKLKKPVAYWSGPLSAGPAEKTWSFKVPEHFNGSLKLFAIAVGRQTLGSEVTSTKVRADMILTPNVLTFAAPGDEFNIPVGVFNNIEYQKDSHEINLSLRHTKNLSLTDQEQQNLKLTIQARKDQTQSYSLKALSDLGNASLTFSAKSSGLENNITETMSIRPASAYLTDLKIGLLEDKKMEIPITREIYTEYAKGELSLGLSPLVLSKSLISFLDKNPYGCSEQIISKAFPYLLASLGSNQQKQKAKKFVEKTIQMLRSRQRDNGSIKLYPSSRSHSSFATLYALHFLIEASERGIKIDQRFKNRIVRYLKGSLSSLPSSYQKSYATFLLTRSEIITTPYLSDINSEVEGIAARMEKGETLGSGAALTLLYTAASYKLLKNNKRAKELIDRLNFNSSFSNSFGPYYNPIVRQTRLLGLISKYFPSKMKEYDSKQLIHTLSKNKRYLTTLSSAYTLLAFDQMRSYLNKGLNKGVVLKQGLMGADGKLKFEVVSGNKGLYRFSPQAKKLTIERSDSEPLFWSFYHAGFSTPDSTLPNNGIEVLKEILDQDGKSISEVKQGDIVTVKLKFRTTNEADIPNGAIVDLLPAGFENVLDQDQAPAGALGYMSDFTNIREDRVISYGRIAKKMQEFSYKIKAVNTGKFIVPGTLIEDLYDQQNIAVGKPSSIVIAK